MIEYETSNVLEQEKIGGSLIWYSDEKHILKLCPLSSCQYVSTIPEKILHVTDLSKIDIL